MNLPSQLDNELMSLLRDVLKAIENLPPNAPDWELVLDFVAKVQAQNTTREAYIVTLQMVETNQRAELRRALENLCQENRQSLSLFNFHECEKDWDLDHLSLENIRATLEEVRQLSYTLQQYKELEQLILSAESVQIKREIRSQIQEQEDQILEMVTALQAPLSTDQQQEVTVTTENENPHFTDEVNYVAVKPMVMKDELALEVEMPVPEMEDINQSFNEVRDEEITRIEHEDKLESPIPRVDNANSLFDEVNTVEPIVQDDEYKIIRVTSEVSETEQATVNREILPERMFETQIVTENLPDVQLIPEEWREFFWQLINQGDVAGAYWLNRSLADTENAIVLPLPDWLVAAVQGSWWLLNTRGSLVQDMAQLAFGKTIGTRPNEKLTAISVALLPSLIVPSTGLGTWLNLDERLPEAFNEIVTSVKEFNFHSRALRRNDVLIVRGEDHRQETLDKLQINAKRWLEEAPHRRAPALKRASDVWYNWTRPNGSLRRMIEIVANSNVNRSDQLVEMISKWRTQNLVDHINQTDAKNMGVKRPHNPIVGSPRNWLMNQAEESIQLVEEWLELTTSDDEKANWYLSQVESLLHKIKISKDTAFQQLDSLVQSTSGEIAPTTIRLLQWALTDVCQFLELGTPTENLIPTRSLFTFPQGIESGLNPGLQYRLFWIPEVGLSNSPDLDPRRLPHVARFIQHTHHQRTLVDAFDLFITRQDYRFVPIILQNEPAINEQKYRESLNNSKSALTHHRRSTENLIEQAVIEGVLDEESRARFESELMEVEQKEEIQDYGSLLNKLNGIRQEIDTQKARHLQHQEERWTEIKSRLQEKQVAPVIYNTIIEYMKDTLTKRDVIVTDERLARLEEILDSGLVPEEDEFESKPERDIYREFIGALDYWETQFNNINLQQIARNLSRGRYEQVLQFEYTLPRPREAEVTDTFNKWYELKKISPSNKESVIESIITVLQYLSFTFLKLPSRSITWKKNERDWVYLSIEMSAGNLSPVPQFGSQQPQGFDVICLWERPGAEVIGSRLHNLKLSFNNVVVLYLGRLTKLHRVRLQQFTREHGLSLAVLDELLLLFLARETDSRLGSFLRCALPLASVNPYAETGPVYREMFFGRTEERKSLQAPSGYALVHGGRQLGKSALLQQVEREFHNPSNERYVYREDIKFIGDPASRQSDPELLWEHLRRGLENLDLLTESVASKSETIISKIKQMMTQHPGRRVLVLFDEADNFLAADMKRNFETVSKLKALMDDTQRRFKVIFAGLHIVQRYEGIPNQPLAHLPNLMVRPLDPLSAMQLIRQPLEALGFRFPENDNTPLLGILAYTNYHPGLIQLFCQKLLSKMYQERPRDIGPFIITRDHVEAVYRQPEVREGIKRRFEWTLALNERYKVLTQLMVLDQIEVKDGYSEAYSVDTLSALARSYWPQAFENSTRDAFKGYLDEMTGLGVLVRNQEGNYRLRSPNLVRLMGSKDDLWGSLSELTSKNIISTLADDSHHAPLDNQANRYSPFTYQQSRVLNTRRYGVSLIFGSKALNIDYVTSAIEEHFVPAAASGKVQKIRIASDGGEAFSQWAEAFLEQYSDKERLILYQHMLGTPETLAEQVMAAVKFCAKRQRSQRQWMRIFFIFDTVATNQWLQLPPQKRILCEEQVDALVILRPWDEIGIAQRLTQHDKIGSEQTVKQILKTLGGWPMLLDILTDRWGKSNDPLPACMQLQQELATPNTEKALSFLQAIGCDIDLKTQQVLQTIASEKDGFPMDMLVPAILGENLTSTECHNIIEYGLRMNLLYQSGEDIFVNHVIRQLIAK